MQKRMIGVGAAAALAAALLASGGARAATVLVVDDDGLATAADCNATMPASNSIQVAVTAAAPGDTVKVCPGSYPEHVVVSKTLTLTGAKAGVAGGGRTGTSSESVITQANDDPNAGTMELQADNIVVDGFLFSGTTRAAALYSSPATSGYKIRNNRFEANAFGLYFNASGDNPSVVDRNYFRINNENLGSAAAAGNGIYSDQGLAGALIQSNKFRGNVNAAVLIAGPTTGLTASGNNSSGDGTFLAAFAGSGFRVLNNTVNASLGSGVYFNGASSITVQGNRIYRSGFSGIRIADGVSGAFINRNTANGSGDQGISVSSTVPGAANVRYNVTNYNNGDGILFASGTRSNVIRYNNARYNGEFDCQDGSTGSGTAGTANIWTANKGITSSPAGLCRR